MDRVRRFQTVTQTLHIPPNPHMERSSSEGHLNAAEAEVERLRKDMRKLKAGLIFHRHLYIQGTILSKRKVFRYLLVDILISNRIFFHCKWLRQAFRES